MKTAHVYGDLTKNQSLVMTALTDAKGPLSAYNILEKLRDHGFKAPLQVYRALEKLVEYGLVHRLESLNAFVACQHQTCDGEKSETVMFTICEECGSVQELLNSGLAEAARETAAQINFALKNSVIELRGLCTNCR